METKVFVISQNDIDADAINESSRVLGSGGLVAFPTETVYGLGGNALDSTAAQKIYAAKGRPSDNPLIIHISDPADAEKYAYTNDVYYRLARVFMPGPLTVILRKRDCIPPSVTGGLDTVAVRCPSHPIARALIGTCGFPIAAPSANLSGSPSPTCAQHVISDLFGRVDVIIDGGDAEIGLESTIVKIDGETLTLLRPGAITVDALSCVCEKVTVAPAVTSTLSENERPLSPGMKYRHYAPKAPLALIDGEQSDVTEFLIKKSKTENCLILAYDEEISLLADANYIGIGSRQNLEEQAKRLFGALREADERSVDKIYAHLPVKDGIGLALYNRLIRAAAHTVITVTKKDI